MTFLVIGDIHGNNEWHQIANTAMCNNPGIKIVFVGDYVDSFHIKPDKILSNLERIINFKKNHLNNAYLLWGNHDYAYLNGFSAISGYNSTYASDYYRLFRDNIDLFDIAYGYENDNKYTLFTHAGLTYAWWKRNIVPLIEDKESFLNKVTEGKAGELPIHEILNFLRDKSDVMWKVGAERGGGSFPSPLWADYRELQENYYPHINQVFGHTPKQTITMCQIEDNFLACVDSYMNKNIGHLIITL